MPRNRFTETPFKPYYVIAIGQLTLAWNDLHEKLAALFCLLMDHQEEDDALIDDTLATPEDWHERDARFDWNLEFIEFRPPEAGDAQGSHCQFSTGPSKGISKTD
jgi:hypothetical protein